MNSTLLCELWSWQSWHCDSHISCRNYCLRWIKPNEISLATLYWSLKMAMTLWKPLLSCWNLEHALYFKWNHSKVKQTQEYKPESSSSPILDFILLSYRYRHGAVSQFSATHHTLLHCHWKKERFCGFYIMKKESYCNGSDRHPHLSGSVWAAPEADPPLCGCGADPWALPWEWLSG